LRVFVTRFRSWEFHVLDAVAGEKLNAHQAEESIHPFQLGPNRVVPAVPDFEPVRKNAQRAQRRTSIFQQTQTQYLLNVVIRTHLANMVWQRKPISSSIRMPNSQSNIEKIRSARSQRAQYDDVGDQNKSEMLLTMPDEKYS
jgi:hypothetical protein